MGWVQNGAERTIEYDNFIDWRLFHIFNHCFRFPLPNIWNFDDELLYTVHYLIQHTVGAPVGLCGMRSYVRAALCLTWVRPIHQCVRSVWVSAGQWTDGPIRGAHETGAGHLRLGLLATWVWIHDESHSSMCSIDLAWYCKVILYVRCHWGCIYVIKYSARTGNGI